MAIRPSSKLKGYRTGAEIDYVDLRRWLFSDTGISKRRYVSTIQPRVGEFPIGRGNVLKEEPLALAVDFVAIQIVLVCPVSVVRDYSQFSP